MDSDNNTPVEDYDVVNRGALEYYFQEDKQRNGAGWMDSDNNTPVEDYDVPIQVWG
jgi:hypothetical protein